jgi:hypothetical protein
MDDLSPYNTKSNNKDLAVNINDLSIFSIDESSSIVLVRIILSECVWTMICTFYQSIIIHELQQYTS